MKTVAIERIEPANVGSDAENSRSGTPSVPPTSRSTTATASNREPTGWPARPRRPGRDIRRNRRDGDLRNARRVVTVSPGETVRFEPGEHQSGKNDADTDAVVLALGAPRDTNELLIPIVCRSAATRNSVW